MYTVARCTFFDVWVKSDFDGSFSNFELFYSTTGRPAAATSAVIVHRLTRLTRIIIQYYEIYELRQRFYLWSLNRWLWFTVTSDRLEWDTRNDHTMNGDIIFSTELSHSTLIFNQYFFFSKLWGWWSFAPVVHWSYNNMYIHIMATRP